MIEFFISNWISFASILIGFVVSYVFYRLQQKHSASAASERTKHATVELLDVVESYIINKQTLSRSLIDNLIQASERFHTVLLRPSCTPVSILQDVALRLQRSRHLDIPQKTEYSVKIDDLIVQVKQQLEPLTWQKIADDSAELIADVLEVVPEEHHERVKKKLYTLSKIGELAKNEGLIGRLQEAGEGSSWLSVAAVGVTAAVAVSTLTSKAFFQPIDELPFVESPLLLTLALATIGVLSVVTGGYALRSYMRLRHLKNET